MDEADKMNEQEDVWMKAKPLRIGFGAPSPRVLVLPFTHSFPPLRFSLSRCVTAFRRRRNRKGKDLNHKPRISSKMATNAMLAHGALTASPASVSLTLSLKPKIRHNVALLAIHNLTIHTFWSHLQIHGSHFDSSGIGGARMLLHEECVSYPH